MKGCKENVETNVTVTKNIRMCYFSLTCSNRNPGGLWEQQQWNSNRFLLKFTADGHEFTVFPDGRAIIKGTSDVDKARTLYAKYIGH